MQANSFDHPPLDNSSMMLGISTGFVNGGEAAVDESVHPVSDPTYFRGYYTNFMEMYADSQTVAAYLDAHREWFTRCARPMKTDALGENGYALTIGKFGSFGYDVEPKIGLDLLPQENGVYHIRTIPIPDYEAPGYEVDFQAAMHLVEVDRATAVKELHLDAETASHLPEVVTKVDWDLNLVVCVQFPRFIQALPKTLVQSTGDRLLNQIVRQVSRRLTLKVQEDFHTTHSISFLKKRPKFSWGRDSHSHLED